MALHYTLRLLVSRDADDTVEFELPGKKYDDMVEFLCCLYPDILNPITGILQVVFSLSGQLSGRHLP